MMEKTLTAQKTNAIVRTILAFYPLVGMSIDLLSPSLPAMGQFFHVDNTIIKYVITLYLLGYAIGNFVLGMLSDWLGRRKLYLLSFIIFTVVSVLPLFIQHIILILSARFLQGFAIAGFVVIGRAILADILDATAIKKVAAYMATMWGIGPIIGPVIGGYLQHYFGWQANFVFYAAYSLIGLLMAVDMPETLAKSQTISLGEVIKNFKTILTHKVFIGVISIMGLTYSILIVFNTMGPFLVQSYFNKSPIYFGHLALLMGLGYLGGTLFCRYLIHRKSLNQSLVFILGGFLSVAFLFLILAFFYNSIMLLACFTFILFLGAGIIYPATMGIALALFRDKAGTGAAIMNLINILIVVIVSMIINFIHVDSNVPFALIYFSLFFFSFIIYFYTQKNTHR